MTSMDKRHNQSRLDDNLDRLLGLGEPAPRMPENTKARIRARLAEAGPGSGKRHFLPGSWALWPLAATAVLVLFLIFFWYGNSPRSIVWADVQQQLNQVHSITLKACTAISATTEKPMSKCYQVYYKDPGLSRTEEYASDASPGSVELKPVKILITRREPGSSERLTLYPESSRVELSSGIFLSIGPEPPSQAPMDLASFNWKLMKEITADKTRRIGDRVINGIPAVGFEFEMPDLLYINPDRQAHGRLWTSSDEGVPLLVEVEYLSPRGQITRMEFSDIRWNVPLDKGIFDLVVPKGWSLSRTRTESAEYTNTGFAPGVILQISPEGREPLAVTEDVAAVVWGEQITHPDSGIPRLVRITIELKPEAMQRLREYTNSYPEELIVVDFNRQIKVVPNLYAAGSTQLSFDLSLLDLSLAELEARYFTTAIERNEP